MLVKIRNESGPVRSLISVPKRKIKSAVRRNLIKRRIKESLRLNKQLLYDVLPENASLNVAIVYIGDEIASYKDIHKSLISLINDTCKRISKIH